ncbi:M23 family metallopeptidase [Labilibaculum filiforme]|nr:M23 family metallopeptidase [Labilibaculum filiforme]
MNSLVIRLFCVITFLSLFIQVKAQSPIQVVYNRQPDNSVDFTFKKSLYGTYFITIEFDNLENAYGDSYSTTITGNAGRVCTLKPKNSEQGINFSYSYRYQQGKPMPKIKDDIVYTLPFEIGTKVKVHPLDYLGATLGDGVPDTWKAFQFTSEKEEVVVAARRGLVVKVVDEFSTDTSRNYSFVRSVNEILIEHKDGTLARYSGFKVGSIKVKEGQFVEANSELGLSGRYNSDKQCQLKLAIYYLNTRDILNANTDAEKANQYGYVNPVFCYKGGSAILLMNNYYVATCTDEIITQEFSKREKKKYVSSLFTNVGEQ